MPDEPSSARGTDSARDKTQDSPNFEGALAELETVVAALERGDISLDESLKYFERGITLTRVCQKTLQDAEQKVEILLKDGAVKPFPREE